MNNKLLLFLVILIIILISVYFIAKDDVKDNQNDFFDFKNSTYVIENRSVTLLNGIAREKIFSNSESEIVTKYFGNESYGDLNGDGLDDIAFILTQNTGGSGTFYYVAVALNTAQGYRGTNTIFLGDRIAPQTTEIRNEEIVVNFAERLPGEAMTAQPSQGVSKYFEIKNGVLEPIVIGPMEDGVIDNNPASNYPVACTMDAKICPDGSAVGRVGPNCEFAPCPIGNQPSPCYVGGCSGQICSDNPGVITTCEYRSEYACYKTAKCERQAGTGQCGWTPTPALTQCLANPNSL